MKQAFAPMRFDEHGRKELGTPHDACGYCGAPATATVSEDDSLVWWHAPSGCCSRRRQAMTQAGRLPYKDAD